MHAVTSAMSSSLRPHDCSPPGSSVHGIFHGRLLEWVAMPFSRGSSRPRSPTHASCRSSIAGGCFTTEPLGRPKFHIWYYIVSGAQQNDSIFLNIMKWIATISLVTLCHHRHFLQDYWLYFLYVHSIPMTYFITGSLYLLIPSLFYTSPYSLLLW